MDRFDHREARLIIVVVVTEETLGLAVDADTKVLLGRLLVHCFEVSSLKVGWWLWLILRSQFLFLVERQEHRLVEGRLQSNSSKAGVISADIAQDHLSLLNHIRCTALVSLLID